ncbi:MAG: MOSC N-terminal beta barrel domain-containing protein [Pseudomonadota bacterium]|nr:MOSC N-terminal beta barrel domain-containing protein [Pseudomonadota bacterium]
MIQITDLFIYPVKSLKGITLDSVQTGQRGLEFDREWMITDNAYNFISQREIESMTTIETAIDASSLILSSSQNRALKVPLESKRINKVKVMVWDDYCDAYDEGDEASSWLTDALGTHKGSSLRLVRFDQKDKRLVPKKYLNGVHAESAFSDQFPYLITSWESLSKLNNGLLENDSTEVSMNRFRPNIVIKGLSDIEKMTSFNLTCEKADYQFGLRKPCKRCKITTINQETGEIDNPKEPLATLVKLKNSEETHGAFFGQNAILLSNYGVLRVGDLLELNR